MLPEVLRTLFRRDLNKLAQELEQYPNEEAIWATAPGINNAAGNLVLHLVGNLNTYVCATLGNSGYVRNREAEFSTKGVPREALVQQVMSTAAGVDQTLERLQPGELANEYPVLVFEARTSTEYMLVHLTAHLSYHLGQVNYHRRLLGGK